MNALNFFPLLALALSAAPPPAVVFSENFDNNNAAGWELGQEWQIGRARSSTGHAQGNPDPGRDHTGREASGVAGVQIGGNAVGSVHAAPYWLTSPAMKVTGARQVTLHFERWLNSDQAPYMTNLIEVWNGRKWVAVWQPGKGESMADSAWVHQAYDVTAHQNGEFRIRFGFARQPGAFVGSSWNLDDVRVEAIYDQKASAGMDWTWMVLVALAALAFVPLRPAR